MKNIRLFYDREVEPADVQRVVKGVNIIGSLCRSTGYAAVASTVRIDDEFKFRHLLPTGQVNTSSALNMLDKSFSEQTIYVTNYDISPPQLNFVFGATADNKTIVSTARLSDLELTGCAAHETGHAFGLVPADQPQYNNASYFQGHCSDMDCIMRPINSQQEMRQAITNNFGQIALRFCPNCYNYLANIS